MKIERKRKVQNEGRKKGKCLEWRQKGGEKFRMKVERKGKVQNEGRKEGKSLK